MNRMQLRYAVLLTGVILGGGLACRGEPSPLPPVHLNPNMDTQAKYKAFGESHFYEDGRTMRTPPAGTVARGFEKDDDAFWRGRDENDGFVTRIPTPVDLNLLHRGQERFNIYCSPCHDKSGTGHGIVAQRGLVPPPNFVDPVDDRSKRILAMPVGEFFEVITNGRNTMPPYRFQIPAADRWAIVAYVRALQRSQNATAADVPEAERGTP